MLPPSPPVRALLLAFAWSASAGFLLDLRWNPPEGGRESLAQMSGGIGRQFDTLKKRPAAQRQERPSPRARPSADVPFQRIRVEDDSFQASFGFRNFDQTELTLDAGIPVKSVADSLVEFGWSDEDLREIEAWYREKRDKARSMAKDAMQGGRVSASSQAELQAKIAGMKAKNADIQRKLDEYLDRLEGERSERKKALYHARGYKFSKSGKLAVDIPRMVKRNRARVRGLSIEMSKAAQELGYGTAETVGALTSLVQTAIEYKIPPDTMAGKYITGVLPPPKTVANGWGDCDTKTALLASLLSAWDGIDMVGVAIPGHYLMGVHQVPERGDVVIEFDGKAYLLVEPAGPAWLQPGRVAETTQQFLETGETFEVERL